jgi:hypothetical protein
MGFNTDEIKISRFTLPEDYTWNKYLGFYTEDTRISLFIALNCKYSTTTASEGKAKGQYTVNRVIFPALKVGEFACFKIHVD